MEDLQAMKKSFAAAGVTVLLLSISAAAFAAFTPMSVEKRNLNGVDYIVKTFEITADVDASALTEPDFEDGGVSYSLLTADSEDITSVETKSVTETQTAESESSELSGVLKKFPSSLPYDAEGFAGTLTLDTGSISTEASG
jgi:hypothetical protein